MGIDPGTCTMGYGLIKETSTKIYVLQYGTLKLNCYPSQTLKLQHIFKETLQILQEYKPDEIACEAPFYGKNVQSMLKLGRAQGVAMAAALMSEIPIIEYAPRKIKQAITGNGNATKEQVAYMLASILQLANIPTQLDSSDALAVAVCHIYQRKYPTKGKKDWTQAIKEGKLTIA
jgi:crossover junction endodeoxyribonuclease RuvC